MRSIGKPLPVPLDKRPQRVENGNFTSFAFTGVEISVDIARLTIAEKAHRRAKSDEYGLVKIAVRDLRQLSVPQEVKHWPAICNYSHGLVNGKKNGRTRKEIANKAQWAIKPKSTRTPNVHHQVR